MIERFRSARALLFLIACLACQAGFAEENASNPLAKVKNTDLRWQYFDVNDDSRINDVYVDGAFMANDKLKIKYELHYWETNLSGESEQGLESSTLKLIYFAREGKLEDSKFMGYRLAIGLDWLVDLSDDDDEAIGTGSDQLAPFVGLALGYESGLTIIPLLQHFTEYDGDDVSKTAFRFIAMKPLAEAAWLKIDAKFPIDWENDEEIPANVEIQYGKFHSKKIGTYVDLLAGLGSDRPYDWGLGLGLRFKY